MKFKTNRNLLLAAGVLATTAGWLGAAQAQTSPDAGAYQPAPAAPSATMGTTDAPGSAPAARAERGRRGGGGDAATRTERRMQHMQARITERLAKLKAGLQLTAEQQGAWEAFAQSVQPTREQMQQRMSQRTAMRSMTTPERIDRMRALRSERNAAMDQRFDATKTFYAQLAPQQQQVFDRTAQRSDAMGGHGHDRGPDRGGRREQRGGQQGDGGDHAKQRGG